MAGHVLHGNGDVRKGCATVAVKASVAEGVAPSKCGCIAGWKTAVHSAGGRVVMALWWSASCTTRRKILSHSDPQ